MKIALLVATVDTIYSKLFSDYISENYHDDFDVVVCSEPEVFRETVSKRKYNVALMDNKFVDQADIGDIHLPLYLEMENEAVSIVSAGINKIKKYQRISKIASTVLEMYSKISKNKYGVDENKTNITAVWSPAGGTGKTTVALAYAMTKANKINDLKPDTKEVFYLNLENFSSVPVYFPGSGKSISRVFELLDNNGDVTMMIKGISCLENGITYLNIPDNYDDINILTEEDISNLIKSCAEITKELIIDLSSNCSLCTKKIFETASKIMIVTDATDTAGIKLEQFKTQNGIYKNIKEKIIFINNKETKENESFEDNVFLPLVLPCETKEVIKKLSGYLRKAEMERVLTK